MFETLPSKALSRSIQSTIDDLAERVYTPTTKFGLPAFLRNA